MSLLNWLVGAPQAERRSSVVEVATLARPADWMFDLWGSKSNSGVQVNEERALRVSAVYQGVGIRARSLAMLPLALRKGSKEGGSKTDDSHASSRLMKAPAANMTRYAFFMYMETNRVLRGNCYAYKVYNGAGEIIKLIPLHPDRVRPDRLADGTLFYWVKDKHGTEQPEPAQFILHVHGGLSPDGIVGYSLLDKARETIGLSLATEEHGARLFSNGTRIGGILKHPTKFSSSEVARRVRESFEAANSGLGNTARTAVLEEGMDWQKVSLTAEEAQFLETRNFEINDLARWLNLPPFMLGDYSRATWANAEQAMLSFKQNTMLPETVCWEQALDANLLLEREQGKWFFKYNLDALVRADYKTRMDGYGVARMWGILSADDCRELEDMNPIPEGKGAIYLQPANYVEAGTPPAEKPAISGAQNKGEEPAPKAPEEPKNEPIESAKRAFSRVFQREISRILAKEANSLRNLVKKAAKTTNIEDFSRQASEFCAENRSFVSEQLAATCNAYLMLSGRENELKARQLSEKYAREQAERLASELMDALSGQAEALLPALEAIAQKLNDDFEQETEKLMEVLNHEEG